MLVARSSVESAVVLLARSTFLQSIPDFEVQKRFRRRTLTPAPWIVNKERPFISHLSQNDRRELKESGNFDYLLKDSKLPADLLQYSSVVLSKPIPDEPQKWTPDSKRCGLIGRKIGVVPQWQTDGTRVLCTMIEVAENHVLWALDPDSWFRSSKVGKHKAFNRFGPMWQVMVGAFDVDPTFLTPEYRNFFERVNVPYKDRMAGFLTTEDAVVKPGTRLDVRHFQVGQFVTVSGKTIDWGFQGVMHRWGMRGQPERHTTKSHRRGGSVGSTGDARVWPGKRMPGHMGYEWKLTSGLEVLRINPLKQVLYVKGCTPGDVGEVLLIKDCANEAKRVQNPPFPTFVPSPDDVEPQAAETPLAEISKFDAYSPKLFRFTDASIVFTEADETPLATRDKSRAKLAKVKK